MNRPKASKAIFGLRIRVSQSQFARSLHAPDRRQQRDAWSDASDGSADLNPVRLLSRTCGQMSIQKLLQTLRVLGRALENRVVVSPT